LPGALPMSVAWECDDQASPHQCAPSSASGGPCTAALAGLESQRAPACLPAPGAAPTGRDEHATSRRRFAPSGRRDPLPRTTSPGASLMGDAPGPQCMEDSDWPRHDQTVRHSRGVRLVPRDGTSVKTWNCPTKMEPEKSTIRLKCAAFREAFCFSGNHPEAEKTLLSFVQRAET
jgi:hypothetical protein